MWAALRPLARDTEPTAAEGEAHRAPSLRPLSCQRETFDSDLFRPIPTDSVEYPARVSLRRSGRSLRAREKRSKRWKEELRGEIEGKGEIWRGEERREKKREPLSWHPVQRVQKDAEAGRGEPGRTARRSGGGAARAWWGRGPHRVGGLGPRAPFRRAAWWGLRGLSCSFSLCLSVAGAKGGAKARGGAAYDPARRVPRVSSYALPRTIDNEPWRTAVVYCREFFGCSPNHRPLTHFCAPRSPSLSAGAVRGPR